ncbi:MAG: class I SAM-dependent methyltransferase [Luteimonas sp.]|nr:class I SAM-dependent methyltransferase [Luteimonas sp.]
MPRDQATAIASAFLPPHRLLNRWDYHYIRSKLSTDPLYPGVLGALRGSSTPLLDLGCGLGLLVHALRQDGQAMPYHGVDNDADKIGRATAAAGRTGLASAQFDVVDLAHHLPAHAGSVAILDVLQYLPAPAQRQLLENVITMLSPGARLVIRTGLVDGSRRGLVSRIGDRAANLIGWMQSTPRFYPSADRLRSILEGAGLQVTIEPLWGRTPFNNWLVVAQRPQVGAVRR